MNTAKYNTKWEYVRIFGDIAGFLLSFLLIYLIRDYYSSTKLLNDVQPLFFYLAQLPILLFILILVLKVYGLYDGIYYTAKAREIFLIFKSILWWTLFLILYFYIFQIDFSRLIFFIWIPLLFIALVAIRLFIKNSQLNLNRQYYIITKIGIIGTKQKTEEFKEIISRYAFLGLRVDLTHIYTTESLLNPRAETEKILNSINRTNIDEIFIVDENLGYDTILNLIFELRDKKLTCRICTDIFELISGEYDIESIGEIPALNLSRAEPSIWHTTIKRLVDLFGSITFLILFSPLLLLIAIVIKCTSSGPVMIKQERVGLLGKRFLMYKFRTMRKDVPLYSTAPAKVDDSRITPFGRILRQTSLDEVPQFLNVLLGQMSLVGPRPEMPFIVETYKPWQKKRLEAKPGITGLWQILGRKKIALSENLEYDFYYINNQSILLDFVIIMKTFPAVLLGEGAY